MSNYPVYIHDEVLDRRLLDRGGSIQCTHFSAPRLTPCFQSTHIGFLKFWEIMFDPNKECGFCADMKFSGQEVRYGLRYQNFSEGLIFFYDNCLYRVDKKDSFKAGAADKKLTKILEI